MLRMAALVFQLAVAAFHLCAARGIVALPLAGATTLVLDPALLLFARDAFVAALMAIVPVVAAVIAPVAAIVVALLAIFAGAGVGDDPFARRLFAGIPVAAALLFGLATLLHVAAEFGAFALLRLPGLAVLFGHAPARLFALAALPGDLLAALAGAFGVVVAALRLALVLGAALLLGPLGHPFALARLVDGQRFAALLLLPALGVAPVLVALRFVVARLARLDARRLTRLLLARFLLPRLLALLALLALFLACGSAVLLVLVVVALLRERGRDAARGEQRTEQGDGQGAGSGKAGHLLSPVGANPSHRMRAVSGRVDESMLRFRRVGAIREGSASSHSDFALRSLPPGPQRRGPAGAGLRA